MIRQLTVRELKERLGEGPRPLVLLDVREPWECGVCRLAGSIAIPLGEIPLRAEELSRDAEIVVVCHHGNRSQHAASYLQRAVLPTSVIWWEASRPGRARSTRRCQPTERTHTPCC